MRTRGGVQSECINNVYLYRLEVEDNTRTDTRDADVGDYPVYVRACGPACDEQPDREEYRARDHRR